MIDLKDYKVQHGWIANFDSFWSTKCDKSFTNLITKFNRITKCDKVGLQIATGLQSVTDCKVIQYRLQLL